MKRSVAMMACVLSGAMVLGSFSPVMAETGAKAVSATVTDSKSSDDKKDDAKADTADKKDDAKDTVLWKTVLTVQSLIQTVECFM